MRHPFSLHEVPRPGARNELSRREKRADRESVSDEQRKQTGCIGGQSWYLYFDQGFCMLTFPCLNPGAATVHKRWLFSTLVTTILLSMAGAVTTPAQIGQSGSTLTLRVQMDGFENTDGEAGVAVWNAPDGFPEDIEHAVATIYVSIEDGAAVTEFDRIAPGHYAITVYHDKNDNRRFDKNWLGMPKEDWGVSNNVRPRLRAPRFDEAVRYLAAGEQLIEIRVD